LYGGWTSIFSALACREGSKRYIGQRILAVGFGGGGGAWVVTNSSVEEPRTSRPWCLR
jgi:hypothetical protein